MWFRAVFLSFFLLCAPAWANSAEEVRALIRAGKYNNAYSIASELNTAEGFALAAESISAQILLGELTKLNKHSKRARDFAQRALSLEPENYNASLQYALADGFVTRTSGDITAWRKKLPTKTLAIIRSFRQNYPEDPRGLALEGAWHMGVIRKTGEKNGSKWFGASLDEGLKLYDMARNKNPSDILIETNYAMSLLVLNSEHYGPYARPILENISQLKTTTDIDRKVQARAALVMTHYEDQKRVNKLAADFLDGEPLD